MLPLESLRSRSFTERSSGETDGGRPRILLFMAPGRDRDLLVDTLNDHYSVETTTATDTLGPDFDCCVFGLREFERARANGVLDRESTGAAFLPIVLLVRQGSDLESKPSLWELVDDIIHYPVKKVELVSRIDNLVERRQLTARLAERESELLRRNERLDEFASIVSHDLRNPLNVAQGRLDIARRDVENEHLEVVASALERMGRLIDDLLDVTKHGGDATDIEPVSLPSVVRACWQNVDTADANLCIETERTIRADPGRLQQLLENLVRNAVEHGGPDVTVTVGDLDKGFYVEDDGPGIPEEDREMVFDYGYTTRRGGTGYGLSIVARVAEAHGWIVRVTDGDDGGARFEFTGGDIVE